MPDLLECFMVICFGISWPVSIIKSYTSRTSKGKSLVFILFIVLGYVFGIMAKIIANNINYVFWFYVLNLVMVLVDLGLFFRNAKLDKKIS